MAIGKRLARGTGVLVVLAAILVLGGARCAPNQLAFIALIASDVYQGRNNGTAGSLAVQEVLIDRLSAIAEGLDTTATGRDAYRQAFSTTETGTNLLALIPGSDLADEYVIVGAHYDHIGSVGSSVFNGATDNAAGVAVVLGIGTALAATSPRRSVILALWDAEEDGLAGAQAYVDSPLVPLAQTVAYVNFDIQGANLLPSLREVSFAVAAESGGETLLQVVREAGDASPIDLQIVTRVFGQDRSDHVPFLNGGVPAVFFSDADGPCYHTTQDDVDVVDEAKLSEQTRTGLHVVFRLANLETPPALAPPSQAGYEDAVAIGSVVDRAVADDLGLFSPGIQSQVLTIQQDINDIVAAGPGAFDVFDGLVLVLAASNVIGALSTLPCDGFLPGP